MLGASFAIGYSIPFSFQSCKNLDVVKKFEKKVKPRKTRTYDIYGERIFYQDFSKIDFSSVEKEKELVVPWDLGFILEHPKIKDKEKLEGLVFEEARKLGYTKESISKLSIKDAILLSVEVVASRINYYDVDHDKKFIKEHGAFLPIDVYFELGKGDCDKYASAVIAVFDVFKDLNKNLKNVYITNSGIGHIPQPHDWNAIIILYENKIVVSHIDPTFYDNGGKLEGEKGFHIPENNLEFLARFYSDILDFKAGSIYYSKLLDVAEGKQSKAEILADLAYLYFQLKEPQKVEEVRNEFLKLNVKYEMDEILYYSYEAEKHYGDTKKAEEFKRQLVKLFPDSYWTRLVLEER